MDTNAQGCGNEELLQALSVARLYGILDLGYVEEGEVEEVGRELLGLGVEGSARVDVLQLRAKGVEVEKVREWAEILQRLCREAGVPFVLNDHVELAVELGLDGVHVGQDDMDAEEVRKQVGAEMLVGLSSHSVEQALAADLAPVDYMGFGPLFATPTKPTYVPIGVEEIATVHAQVKKPIFCIGGVKRENLKEVMEAGAKRVVVVSGILQARDRAEMVGALQERLRS